MTEDTFDIFKREVLEDDHEVREDFLNNFRNETQQFIDAMVVAHKTWQKYDGTLGTNKRKGYVSAFLFNAINNLTTSMKLFISGYSIPSGNLVRQTIESLCSAILCSNASLNYHYQVDQDKFSPQKSIYLVLKNAEKFKINKQALKVVKKSYEFYHKYSHSSLLALTHNISLSQKGALFIGPAFDNYKMPGYKKEIAQRLSLAKVFTNIIEGILLFEEENNDS